jgi:hypothetical protein
MLSLGKGLVVVALGGDGPIVVKKGTLLMAAKAYAVGPPGRSGTSLAVINPIRNIQYAVSQVRCRIDAIQRLRREPSSAAGFYSLWAGPDYKNDARIPSFFAKYLGFH